MRESEKWNCLGAERTAERLSGDVGDFGQAGLEATRLDDGASELARNADRHVGQVVGTAGHANIERLAAHVRHT